MTKNLDANKIISVINKIFEVPEDPIRRLKHAKFTDRQAKALMLFGEGKSLRDISKEISGSSHTQNTYDALGSAISKLFSSMLVLQVVSENKEILTEILRRGLNFSYKGFKLEQII